MNRSRSRSRRVQSSLAAVAIAGVVALLAPACGSNDAASGCPQRAIAFMGPITGNDGANGRSFRSAIETALSVASESGPLAKCPVGLVSFDTRADPTRAAALAEAIAEDPQIIAVVGPAFSGETAAAMPILEAAGVPVITASATNSALGTKGWRHFHRVVVDDATQAPAAAAFMVDQLAVKSVAVIDDGSLYGKGLADLVATALGSHGVVVAPRLQIEADSLDYRSAVESVRSIGVDAVYFGGVTDPAARLVRQLRDAGIKASFVAGDGVFQPEFISLAGNATRGAIVTCPCTIGGGSSSAARDFSRAFERRTGSSPPAYATEYADATRLVLDAIVNGARSRAQMEKALDDSDVEGITKQLSFDADGQIRSGPVFVFTVTDGSFVQTAAVERGVVTLTPSN